LPIALAAWSYVGTARRLSATNKLRDAILSEKPPATVLAALRSGANPNAHTGLLSDELPKSWLRLLLDRLTYAQPEDPKSTTLLVSAAYDSNLKIVQLLLEYGADPNLSCRANGSTANPLCSAACSPSDRSLVIVETLLAHGARVDSSDSQGVTPLMHAVSSGHVRIVQALIEHGAEANRRDHDGMTALHYLGGGDDFFNQRRYGENPAHMLSVRTVVQSLVQHGAAIDAVDVSGDTALCIAANNNYPGLVQILLELGADPNYRDLNDVCVLSYAQDAEVSNLLRKAGAKWPYEPMNSKNAEFVTK
jgi:ankyrin repeat protein